MAMSGYTKLFNSILASTIWREDDQTRLVWITMLAMADKQGMVEASVPGLADFARVPLEACKRALDALSAPDEYSRSREHDGRRIETIDGGWRLLNHSKYRERLGADERREYLRLKQRQYREARKQKRQQMNTDVSDTDTLSTHAEADTDTDTDTKANTKIGSDPIQQANFEVRGSTTKPATASNTSEISQAIQVTARSKRPIFTGQRLTVFEWMLDDCLRTLGPQLAQEFDLHEWFFALDARAVKQNIVIPKRDGGAWLQDQLIAEARRRGLPFASADNLISDQGKKNLAAMHEVIARIGAKP